MISPLEKVTLAQTKEERDACARFGYDVYVKELGYNPPGTDHDRQIVWEELDDSPYARHYYAGPVDDIRGIIRLLVWPPGTVDPKLFRAYSMSLYQGIDKLSTMEVGRLMIRPKMRGKLIFPSLARRAFADGCSLGVELGFAECRPGLVPHYRRMGLRPYRADLIQTPEGLMVPMVLVMSDLDYHHAVGSIAEDIVARVFGPGGRPVLDISAYASLLHEDVQRIEVDAERVWASIENDMAIKRLAPTLFDGVSDADRRAIVQGGLLLELQSGADVAVEGRSEQEIYLLLEGSLKVITGEHTVATLEAGEVFGEMAFFRPTCKRSATVRAVEPSRILALSRNFLERLKREHTDAALKILFNLGRIVSERLAAQIVRPAPAF
ncbi:MAG: cyclic nucleotide-binding domain-containing protein [Proteobacteria bacterium]|nr:cyclic nucleotide-binding domain-containing protein [Pseudomonadota bacterium]